MVRLEPNQVPVNTLREEILSKDSTFDGFVNDVLQILLNAIHNFLTNSLEKCSFHVG